MSNISIDRTDVVVDIAIDATSQQSTNGVNSTTQPDKDEARLRSLLLRMGNRYLKTGSPNQALELFLTLVEEHPDTEQAASAKEQLLDICSRYESEGKFHQARALYERLLS